MGPITKRRPKGVPVYKSSIKKRTNATQTIRPEPPQKIEFTKKKKRILR